MSWKGKGTGSWKEGGPCLFGKFPIKGCEELMIPTRGGNALVHLYRPQALTSPLPAVINFHGGGFVKGYRGRDIEFSQMIASRGTYLVLMWTTRLPRNIPTHAPLKKGKMWSLIFWHIWQTMTGTGTVRHSWGKAPEETLPSEFP